MGFLDTVSKAKQYDAQQEQMRLAERQKVAAYDNAKALQERVELGKAMQTAHMQGRQLGMQEGLASSAANVTNQEMAEAQAMGIQNPTMEDIDYMRRLKSLEQLQGGSIGAPAEQGLAQQSRGM